MIPSIVHEGVAPAPRAEGAGSVLPGHCADGAGFDGAGSVLAGHSGSGCRRQARGRTGHVGSVLPGHCAATTLLSVLCTLVLVLCLLPATAHAITIDTSDDDIGTLADRFSTLDDLSNSKNSDDEVVVNTRIAVLASVNRALDKTEVRFTGEAVGEIIDADDEHKWVNVCDNGGNSIGVYMTDEQAEHVVNCGDYKTTGTVLDITGAYYIACDAHQGALDVHASQVSLVDAGGETTHEVDVGRLVAGVVLCAVALALVIVFVVLRARSGRGGKN